MSRKDAATLLTLPVEMLHRIFDELNGTMIIMSMRNVCQLLRVAVDNYHRYALDMTSFTKPDFHRLLPLIRPKCVTALSLSDREPTPGQIGLFLSLVEIGVFTRLRSLTLLGINEYDLCLFLKHANRCSLTSLVVHSRFNSAVSEKIGQHLSAVISQPSLIRLELLTTQLCDLLAKCEWSVQCRLRYLKMACDTEKPVSKMIAVSPDLETLVLDDASVSSSYHLYPPKEWFAKPCPRLTSLTLLNFFLPMNQVQSILSQTPSLRHLKIVTRSLDMVDGSRWEELIKSKLPFLNKFEYYSRFFFGRPAEETEEAVPNELIVPFCTPFWTKEKRWLVTCNIFPTKEAVEIYTSPICVLCYIHVFDPKMKTISNFEGENPHSTALEKVKELSVNLCGILVDDHVSNFQYTSLA